MPDPASHQVSTVGGNATENAGGLHCLKYGITTNHILGLEMVLPSGEIAEFGGAANDHPDPDLTALCVGAEGTLGLATKFTVRDLSPLNRSSNCVSIWV